MLSINTSNTSAVTEDLTITIDDVNEAAPVFAVGDSAAASVAETTTVGTYTATDADGTATQAYSITGGTGGTPGTYDVTQASTTGSGTGCQIRVVTDGSSTPTVVVISGGAGHVAGNVITFSGGAIGSSSNLTI